MTMNYLAAAAALIAAMLLLGALADADAAGVVSVAPDDAIKCELQGGCSLVTHEYLIARLKAAYEAGKREAACRPTT